MNYRPARWTPPASHQTSVRCSLCGKEEFTVLYISETLGVQRCEACLRSNPVQSPTEDHIPNP